MEVLLSSIVGRGDCCDRVHHPGTENDRKGPLVRCHF